MRTSLILMAVLTTLSAASTQSASYRIVGTPCTTGRLTSGVGPVPLSVRGLPRIGTSFTVVTEGSARYPWGSSRAVFLFTGFSNTSAGGLRLPFDVSTLFPGEPFCGLLRTSAELRMPLPLVRDYRQAVGISFTIPNDRTLIGIRFFQQVMSLERSSFGPPFRAGSLSAGGEAVIGL